MVRGKGNYEGILSAKKKKKKRPVIRTGKVGRPRVNIDALRDPNPVGRPTRYREEFCDVIFYARALGATDESLCDRLKINRMSLYRFLNKYPKFRKAYEDGKYFLEHRAGEALAHKLKPRPLKRTETKEYLDKFGNVQQLKTETIQEADIDVLALNNFLNRRIASFKEKIEDANTEKVDMLLNSLASICPVKMQEALDRRAIDQANKAVTATTIEVNSLVEDIESK